MRLLTMNRYLIQTAAQLTGMSAVLIRAWEARYGLVQPERTASGYRLYSEEEIALLKGAQQLVKRGMSPAQIARLPHAQVISGHLAQANPPKEPDRSGHASSLKRSRPEKTNLQQLMSVEERIDLLVEAFRSLDNAVAEELLSVPIRTLPIDQVCHQLLFPLLVEVGNRWHEGKLSVAAEHFGTALIRNHMTTLLREVRSASCEHSVLCACPPGEPHDMGLLLFALEATVQGWDALFLGADVPLAELVQTAQKVQPSFVALSFVLRPEPEELSKLLSKVVGSLPPVSKLLVGGCGLRGLTDVVRRENALMMPESGKLSDLHFPSKNHPSQRSPRVSHPPKKSRARTKSKKRLHATARP